MITLKLYVYMQENRHQDWFLTYKIFIYYCKGKSE